MKKLFALFFFLCAFVLVTTTPLAAQPGMETAKGSDAEQKPEYAFGQQTTGVAVLQSILIADGKLVFRTASGGCTDKNSFRIDVEKKTWNAAGDPLYVLTVIRIRPDECKAFLAEGVEISFDLEKDLGLIGAFTVIVANPVSQNVK